MKSPAHDLSPNLTATLRGSVASRFTTTIVAAAALTVFAWGAASAQNDASETQSAALIELNPSNGHDLEAAFAAVGMDAVWGAETGLARPARSLSVDYDATQAAQIDELVSHLSRLDATIQQQTRVGERARLVAIDLADALEVQRDAQIEWNLADHHLAGIEAFIQSVALDLFAGSGEVDNELLGADGQALARAQRTIELRDHTLGEMMVRREAALERLAAAQAELDDATAVVDALTAERDELREETTLLLADRASFEDDLRAYLPTAAEAFALADVDRVSGMTVRAASAYIAAELTMAETKPSCRISWRTIAAVGGVEGAHGEFGGRTLGMDGVPSSPILGLVLDGANVDNFGDTVAAIRDTDGGRYDGDTRFDRAVGPMQFIPGTWARWGADGDGDGDDNPQDLDDAALAAGQYLCNYGSHANWANWSRSIHAYNHSNAYVNSVASRLASMQAAYLPAIEGVDLWPSQPYGSFAPLPVEDEEDDKDGDDAKSDDS